MERLSPTKKCTLILLVFLSQIFRYPITPSPTATDNFFYITIAKSILDSGQMFWAHESLSLYGLYPGTTPMGSIIVASALTEVTNLSVHDYQLVHSFLFSLVATLSFFMLSGEFSNNYRTRWFSSLCFSLAPLFLSLTLWRLSLRFSFISFLSAG